MGARTVRIERSPERHAGKDGSGEVYILILTRYRGMMVEPVLRRNPRVKAATPSIFVPERKPSHRPPARYRCVRIRSRADVATARRAGLPLSLLEPRTVEALGYPLHFRPCLLLHQPLVSLVETTFRSLTFVDPEAARHPGLEDIIVAMLSIDALGARRIAHDHQPEIDPTRLLKRVLAENQEGRAYEVRIDQFAPGIPKVRGVRPLARAALRAEDARRFSREPP